MTQAASQSQRRGANHAASLCLLAAVLFSSRASSDGLTVFAAGQGQTRHQQPAMSHRHVPGQAQPEHLPGRSDDACDKLPLSKTLGSQELSLRQVRVHPPLFLTSYQRSAGLMLLLVAWQHLWELQ